VSVGLEAHEPGKPEDPVVEEDSPGRLAVAWAVVKLLTEVAGARVAGILGVIALVVAIIVPWYWLLRSTGQDWTPEQLEEQEARKGSDLLDPAGPGAAGAALGGGGDEDKEGIVLGASSGDSSAERKTGTAAGVGRGGTLRASQGSDELAVRHEGKRARKPPEQPSISAALRAVCFGLGVVVVLGATLLLRLIPVPSSWLLSLLLRSAPLVLAAMAASVGLLRSIDAELEARRAAAQRKAARAAAQAEEASGRRLRSEVRAGGDDGGGDGEPELAPGAQPCHSGARLK